MTTALVTVTQSSYADRSNMVTDDAGADRRSFRFLLPTALICLGGLAVLSGVDASLVRQWLTDAGQLAPLLFVVLGVLAMSVLVPKTVVSVTAGALFGTAVGSLLMLVTAVAAAALNYSIGRWWLYDSIERKLVGMKTKDRTLWIRAIRDVARQAGFRFHLLIRLTPIPTTLISYTMGASASRIGPFLLAAGVAVLPQTLWVHGGTAVTLVKNESASWLQWSGVIVSVTAAIAIGILVPRFAIERIEQIKSAAVERDRT